MRIVALIIVLGIVYLVYGKNGGTQSLQDRLEEARQEAAPVDPIASAPVAANGSLRAPIDRTRQVLEVVKTQNTE